MQRASRCVVEAAARPFPNFQQTRQDFVGLRVSARPTKDELIPVRQEVPVQVWSPGSSRASTVHARAFCLGSSGWPCTRSAEPKVLLFSTTQIKKEPGKRQRVSTSQLPQLSPGLVSCPSLSQAWLFMTSAGSLGEQQTQHRIPLDYQGWSFAHNSRYVSPKRTLAFFHMQNIRFIWPYDTSTPRSIANNIVATT
jgi:hypothetical protein